jgi:lipid II:glycine glycyltransferase (peptidoglycan interpeptide bridge formation enzyme)
MNPNMVLYWEMIKYSIDQKMKVFSFGRATKGSGSHKFKTQWGIEERQIYFNYSSYQLNIRNLSFLSKLWKILPLEVANKVGPYFRNINDIIT